MLIHKEVDGSGRRRRIPAVTRPYGSKPGEQEIIGRIFQLRGQGLAVREIIETLHKEGLKPRGTKKNKDARWQHMVVVRILNRPNIA